MRTVVWVRWFDASFQRGECGEEELCPVVELESAGLLVADAAESISIALDRYEADGVWRYVQHIPRVCVREVRRLTA